MPSFKATLDGTSVVPSSEVHTVRFLDSVTECSELTHYQPAHSYVRSLMLL